METPKGFIPSQDMGYLFVNVQLPDSASSERTDAVMRQLQDIALHTPGIRHAAAIRGQSFVLSANGSNFGTMFVNLKDYEQRRTPDLAAQAIAGRLWMQFEKQIPDAMVQVFPPPPVRGAGRAGGFAFMIEDRGDLGLQELQKQTEILTRRANGELSSEVKTLIADLVSRKDELGANGMEKAVEDAVHHAYGDLDRNNGLRMQMQDLVRNPDLSPDEMRTQLEDLVRRSIGLMGVFSAFRANVPQLRIEPDLHECMAKGVRLNDFADTLAIYQGSLYVNDFNLFGRTWQVIVQADSQFRDQVEDLPRLKVRNRMSGMVPLGSLADIREVNGPLVLTRYNMYPAAAINGGAGPGMSSFEAIAVMQKIAKEVFPRGMAYEWTDMSYLEVKSGDDATKIFVFAVLMVFLVLAFQYENWSLPLAVILVVPMCLLSAIIGVQIAHMDINIFTRIGFVVLVGLASKNAILIVEFAKVQRAAGMPRRQAALEACKLRLRPIIMTSLAFVLGVLPLMISHGAGFEMRRTLGTAVFSGMLGVTLFGIFLTPVFFVTVDSLGETRLFASRSMRLVSSILLAILRPGFVRALTTRSRSRVLPALPASKANGTADPTADHPPAQGHVPALGHGHPTGPERVQK
jgi:multidrug efflux pump